MRRLREVLIVDDLPADIYLHRLVLEELDCAERISVARNGREAITYLTTAVDGSYPSPELICLDINMPVMSGWQFLDAYAALPAEQRTTKIIMMVTTSLNPDDEKQASSAAVPVGFARKPLTEDLVRETLQQYFAEHPE